MNETRRIECRRLWEVERLTMRQIAARLRMGRKTVPRILRPFPPRPRKPSIIAPYEWLIAEWYKAVPSLIVLQRLRGYGYRGGDGVVKRATAGFRKKRKEAFFELEFLPGEEAHVDWMEWVYDPG